MTLSNSSPKASAFQSRIPSTALSWAGVAGAARATSKRRAFERSVPLGSPSSSAFRFRTVFSRSASASTSGDGRPEPVRVVFAMHVGEQEVRKAVVPVGESVAVRAALVGEPRRKALDRRKVGRPSRPRANGLDQRSVRYDPKRGLVPVAGDLVPPLEGDPQRRDLSRLELARALHASDRVLGFDRR